MSWKKVVSLAGAAGVLALSLGVTGAGSAAASGPQAIGGLYANTVGVPKSVREGRTFYAHTWYKQTSRDTMIPYAFEIAVMNVATKRTSGVTVSVLNPVTHRWQSVPGGVLNVHGAPNLPRVTPNRWIRFDFRVTFARTARPGTWQLRAVIPMGYWLLTPTGASDPAYLRLPQDQAYKFAVTR